jgi:FkbM family methyltransferase
VNRPSVDDNGRMQALKTYQRAVDRYGWLEAMRRAPRAVAESRVRDMIRGAGLEPEDVVVISDEHFGTQVARKRTTDWSTYRQIFLREDWRFKRSISPGTVIDLGANVGYATVWYHATFPEARIVAIEPDAANSATARLNIALGCHNGADISLEQTAIWHTDSWLKISNPDGKASGLQVTEAEPGEPGAFKATTVGSIMDRHGMDTVDVVKVDIETSERFLFAKNTGWLDRVNCVAIEFHDRIVPGCREPVVAALDRHFGEYDEVSRGENTMFQRRHRLAGSTDTTRQ